MSARYWCRSTPNHNSLVTTTPSGDAGSTWVLRHNLDPEHVPAFRHPVTIDPSGDPTLEFQTGSMIHPELMSYRRSEPVGDNRSRRWYIIADPTSRTDPWPSLYVASRTWSRIQFRLRDAPRFSECGSHAGSPYELGGHPEFIIGSRLCIQDLPGFKIH